MDSAYLQDDFDASSLRVADLKAVLHELGVPFSSASKKAQLLDLFHANVTAKRAELRAATAAADEQPAAPKTAASAPAAPKPTKKKSKKKPTDDVSSPETHELASQKPKKHKHSKKEPDTPPSTKSKRKSSFSDSPKSPKRKKGKLFEDETDLNEAITKSLSPKKPSATTPTAKKVTSQKTTPKAEQLLTNPHLVSPKHLVNSMPNMELKPEQEETRVSPKEPRKEIAKEIAPAASPKTARSPKHASSAQKASKLTPKKSPSVPPEPFKNLDQETEDFDKFFKKPVDKKSPMAGNGQIASPNQEPAPNKLDSIDKNKVPDLPEPIIGQLKPKSRTLEFMQSTDETDNNKPRSEEEDEISYDEDDTEAEEEEKALEQLKTEIIKESIVRPTKSLLPIFAYLSAWFILLFLGLFGYWYREQTFLIGYCGNEIDEPTFTNNDHSLLMAVGGFLDRLKPDCVPCPPHARCFENLQVGCYEDFIEYKPWYFDIVPFLSPQAKKCVPDTNKAGKLEMMIDVSLDLLRSKNALVNCGANSQDNFESGLKVDELYEMLLSIKAPYITTEEFDELWERAIVELEKEPEIITGFIDDRLSANSGAQHKESPQDKNKVFRSTSLSHISLKCQLQRAFFNTLVRYQNIFIAIGVGCATLVTLMVKVENYKTEAQKIDKITHEVIDKLKAQKKLSRASPNIPPFIGGVQLRDVLVKESNLSAKLKLWNKVCKRLQANTNISSENTEVNGEILLAWEWTSEL